LSLGGRGAAPGREKRGSRDFSTAWAGKAGINKLEAVFEHCDDERLILIGPGTRPGGGRCVMGRRGTKIGDTA